MAGITARLLHLNNMLVILVMLCLAMSTVTGVGVVNDTACSAYSASDSDDFWDAAARCDPCKAAGCGFCVSTLQCLSGTSTGPTNGSPCPQWSYGSGSSVTCPSTPNCGDYTSCGTCSPRDECAWCASQGVCTTISDAFTQDCTGLVFEPPCPDTYVADNVIVGNLVVQADDTFGGGNLNITGSTFIDETGTYVTYSMDLNSTMYYVQSSGDSTIESGHSVAYNGIGGSVNISAGSGTNVQGGSGGSLSLSAGDGYGEAKYGANIGQGGDVEITAGSSIEGSGGDITLSSGSTLTGTGGSMSMTTGDSQSGDTGAFSVTTASSGAGTSGGVSMSTGSGATASGSVQLTTGSSTISAGDLSLSAGTSAGSVGAQVSISAGDSSSSIGGIITIKSGAGTSTSTSGAISIASADANIIAGDSGMIRIVLVRLYQV